ncbi:hypothetical protein CDL15_Pgr008732 [Punica granatum]|uniref:Uncharacterized protein n=1 Tax=Punica granatum TaxID=22663 RepID=A0A218VXD9_PUNGR|nr:hypothetical protein CDL15_Pgr008732 [Punica granatum]PKI43865.1 hypothetical protein CRG98_035699 [Punica granatum]
MEKAEKVTKRRAPTVEVDGLRKRARLADQRLEAEDDEVEEFFAILRRMHRAVQYFEGAGGDSGKWAPGTWRAAIETGAKPEVNGGAMFETEEDTPELETGRQSTGLVLDLNASPEESRGND